MAEISIVNKRIQSLHDRKISSEPFYPISGLKSFRNRNDMVDAFESLSETSNLMSYSSAISDLKNKTSALCSADIIMGASILAEKMVPRTKDLSALSSTCNMVFIGNTRLKIDLVKFYTNDSYTSALETIDENAYDKDPYHEAYKIISEAITEYRAADRVINNHETLSKRYNFDKIVHENMNRLSADQSSLIWKICNLIETFNNFTYHGQYTACLENTLYLFAKNGVWYNIENIAEAVTDYFLLIHERYDGCLNIIKTILRNNTFFKDTEFAKNYTSIETSISDYYDSIRQKYNLPEDYTDADIIKDYMDKDIQETFMNGLRSFKTYAHSYNGSLTDKFNSYSLAEAVIKKNNLKNMLTAKSLTDKTIDDLIKEFKIQDKKDVGTFKNLINKIYAKNPIDAINHTPSILNIIRVTITYSTIALLPIIGVVLSIIDAVVASNINRAQTEKMIGIFNEEKEKVKDEIRHTDDSEKKERLIKYLKEINNAIASLGKYREEIITHHMQDTEGKLDDMVQVPALFEALKVIDAFDPNAAIKCLRESYRVLPLEFIDSITELSLLIGNILNRDTIHDVLKESYKEISKDPIENYMTNLNVSNCLYENMVKIEICKYTYEDFSIPTIRLAEVLKILNPYLKNKDYLLEQASVQNTFKLAAINIKNKVTNLSGGQRDEATKMSTFATTVKTEIEDYVNKNTRADILKSSVLPKFVIMINLIINSTQATAIKVTIASSAANWLGTLACRPNATDQERRLIFDEIVVQIETVNKQILADEKKEDFSKYTELRDLKRNLEREAQRIKNRAKLIGKPL